MDFVAITSDAWRITWRNRGLWLVGLFAGGATGSCGTSINSGVPSTSQSADLDRQFGQFSQFWNQIPAFLERILPVLIVTGILFAIVYIAFWLLSIACKSAVIAGCSEAFTDRPVSLGLAWSSGTRAFGRLLVLDLVVHVITLVVIGLFGMYALARLREPPASVTALLDMLSSLFALFALVGILGSLLGVVVGYAQRAIVLDGAAPLDSVRLAFSLARRRLGTSLLFWLIGIVLAITGGIILVIGLVVVLIPVLMTAAIVGLLFQLAVQSGFGVGLTVVSIPLMAIAIIVGAAALNTLQWHYWTVAYLRISRPTHALAPAAEGVHPAD